MGKARRKVDTWESVIEELGQLDTRWMIRRTVQTVFIQVKDRRTGKQTSLRPLAAYGRMEDVVIARDLCIYVGNSDWPNKTTQALISSSVSGEEIGDSHEKYDWKQVAELTNEHLTRTMKGSSAKNIRADLKSLTEYKMRFKWEDLRAWVFDKAIDTRPFKNRLDSLEQIRLALSNKYGTEPTWLKRTDLDLLRENYNRARSKTQRYNPAKEIGGVRGIPTRAEAEAYLDSLDGDYELEQWCLAMMINYGLRNHELHHISPITKASKKDDMQGGWVFIPAGHRTKSKLEHWVWPLYPSWIKRYKLDKNFEEMQAKLWMKARPKIVSALDKTMPWDKSNDNDLGVCDNNDYLGSWITKRMKEVLPEWKASVPNQRGQHLKSDKKEQLTPYDLRHTWAIRMATDKDWSHVSDSDCSAAMGHDLATHRKHYQKWISTEESRKKVMLKIILPDV